MRTRPADSPDPRGGQRVLCALLVGVLGVPTATAAATCPALPRLDCRRPAQSVLALQTAAGATPSLLWRWSRGDATTTGEFGDPTTTTGYALCAYESSHSNLVLAASIPADASRWRSTGSRGYRFRDASGAGSGIRDLVLQAGADGRANVTVRGRGASLPALPLEPDLPLRIQLVNDASDACWEDVYDGTDVRANGASRARLVAGPEALGATLPVLRAATALPRLDAAEAGVPAFVGATAVAAPMVPLVTPLNPFLDPDGDGRIHHDAYNSAVYNRAGPLGSSPTVNTVSLVEPRDIVNVCAMLTFTPDGYVVGSCINAFSGPAGSTTRLLMLDPVTLDVHADVALAPRPLVQGGAGGAYFSVLEDGRILIGPGNNHIETWEIEINGGKPQFVRRASIDVGSSIPPGGLLQDTVIDYQGRLWFIATTGEIGYVDPAIGIVHAHATGEALQNSLAVDASGVYVTTSASTQKFSVAPDGTLVREWRTPYDNSGPGILQPGSGTTPTLFGEQDDLIVITDTATPQVNMVVLDRTTGAVVCETPLFRPGESGAENTFLTYGDDAVIVNNSGFPGVFGPQRLINPGMERHRVRADRSGCDPVWINHDAIANSAQLSTTTGLIYGWAPDPLLPDLDAYYFTANDWVTGAEVYRVYAGNDLPFNPVMGQPHLGLDGAAYVGTLHGIVRIADTP